MRSFLAIVACTAALGCDYTSVPLAVPHQASHVRHRRSSERDVTATLVSISLPQPLPGQSQSPSPASGPQWSSAKAEALAMCLTDKGAALYGALWCPGCKLQKDMFGPSVSKLLVVDCEGTRRAQMKRKCVRQGIEKYPTWIMPDGSKLEGAHPPRELAMAAGCPSPY